MSEKLPVTCPFYVVKVGEIVINGDGIHTTSFIEVEIAAEIFFDESLLRAVVSIPRLVEIAVQVESEITGFRQAEIHYPQRHRHHQRIGTGI